MSFYNNENWPAKKKYYRWPWSNNDNPVQWLEITDRCNIHCKGCYRQYLEGDRPLETLKKEVEFAIEVRNIDTVCIAGGEPLIYPHIVPLVEFIAKKGIKPNIITNTEAMTKQLVTDLYNAGIYGFTNHIDMMQSRDRWKKDVTELDLMPERQKICDLIYEVGKGKIYCTYNMTTYHENFKYVKDVIEWSRRNVRKVHGVEFITYRGVPLSDKIEWDIEETKHESKDDIQKDLTYTEKDITQLDINSVDVYNYIKDNFGASYEPCAYLGGTGHVKDYKWWAHAGVMEEDGRSLGCVGPKSMEFLQINYHFFMKRYFMYLKGNSSSRLLILLTALIGDKAMAPVRRKVLLSLLNPVNWFKPVHFQSIGINQPPDMGTHGETSMCESCPDACVWEGNMVSSCRLDEYRKYGRLMNVIAYEANTDKRNKG